MTYVPPSIRETAFNCPRCGALAKQFWFDVFAKQLREDRPTPITIGEGGASELNLEHLDGEDDAALKQKITDWADKMSKGLPFLEDLDESQIARSSVHNLSISKCYNCKNMSLWIHDRLVFPTKGEAPIPNPDLPEDIIRDYNEASAILDASPRGAAALIRLAIQKLCKFLGQPGRNINDDIKQLVAAGLDQRVQKSLDAVRVIGNNAVHPGIIDLKDDRATAESLFKLLNLVAEKTISEPKHVEAVYASLPENARKAIENRDGAKGKK